MDYSATGTRRQNLREVSTISYPDDDIESEEGTGSVDSNKMTPYIIDQELTNLPAALHRAIQNSSGTFGEVNINNSKDVHIGPKIYTAPVTLEVVNARHEPRTELDCSDIIQEKGDILDTEEAAKRNSSTISHFIDILRRSSGTQRIAMATFCTLLLILITLSIVFGASRTDQQPYPPESATDPGTASPPYDCLVSRSIWSLQPPAELDDVESPVPLAVITHTATPGCDTATECTNAARSAQAYHMRNMGWKDVGYNFLVGGDGYVYVGRGWGKEGCHTRGFNKKSVGIAFIGLYHDGYPNYDTPTQNQIRCTRDLLHEGVVRGYLSLNYSLVGYCDLSPGIPPGNTLLKEIRSWLHYGLPDGQTSKCVE